MNTDILSLAGRLSDQQLVNEVKLMARHEREATAALIAHLAVLDERGLYLAEGCSSMFTYCVQVLHLSEHAAYGRIEAVRVARKFPIILGLLGDGSVNLTTVTLLGPHLTPENHVNLLALAKHLRKRQVEELIAALRPQPCVPTVIRRLPVKSRPASPSEASGDALVLYALPLDPDDLPAPAAPRPAVVAPLAPERYKVQFTASAKTHAKLLQAQELLRFQISDGDVGEIIDRALTALLRNLSKQKFGATDRPREKSSERPGESSGDRKHESMATPRCGTSDSGPRSRHIPAEVKRTVWARDGGQCAFVGSNRRRCTARAFLEFHHVVPCSAGGEATVENIQLRCHAHNGYEAELYFGHRRRFGRNGRANADRAVNSVQTELAEEVVLSSAQTELCAGGPVRRESAPRASGAPGPLQR